MRYDGKVAIITGAGRGIGAQYALLLGARGCQVVVNDLGIGVTGGASDEDPAAQIAAEIVDAGGTAISNRNDVVEEADAVVASAIEAYGRVDIVINNAGITGGGPFHKVSRATFDQLFDTHFKGTVNVSRAAWPHLLAAGQGRVVNTASPAVFGGQFIAHYASAKAATLSFTKVLAAEGARKGVHVNAVAPSASTRMTSFVPGALSEYVDDYFPPADVAAFVAWLVHASTTVNGEAFVVGGGVARRIVLAVNRGVKVTERAPESWAAVADRLLAPDGLDLPGDLVDDMRFHAERLGGAALSAFEAIAGS